MRRIPAILLVFILGCGGIYGSNVGEPNSDDKARFRRAAGHVRVGMPEDSLARLFGPAEKAGEVGILLRSVVDFGSLRRCTYQIGWKSEPRHQGSFKRPEQIDRVQIIVETSDGIVTRIERIAENE